MSSSGQRTQLKLLTVGDFDPQSDGSIEYDFVGRVVAGRYTVEAHIGGGGMADVFRAADAQLEVDVAIKLLKPRMASSELRARMVQEARAAAQVRHPNLVRVFGTDELDGTAYIAMELLDGPNLEDYLRARPGGRLPWREALALLLPALEALHAIHERGYVHRDIKAGNILVVGDPPTAIVIDLGLVKPNRALRTAASPPTTEVGRMLCTPGYTSPEQAAELPVDRRSDVYSMAVTLYRVLAGRLPFHAARGQPLLVVLAKHIHDQPTRLVEAAAGAEIPRALAAVIEAALSKSPADRPQTMLAFAAALREAGASVRPAAPRADRRHGGLWLAAGLGAGVLLGAATRGPLAAGGVSCAAPAVCDADGASSTAVDVDGSASTVRGTADAVGLEVDGRGTATTAAAGASTDGREPATPLDAATAAVGLSADGRGTAAPRDGATAGRGELMATWRRGLARRTPEVQGCADAGTGSIGRVEVAVNIDVAGRVFARVVGADTPFGRCVERALADLTLAAPRRPVSFVHTFKLRVTPRGP